MILDLGLIDYEKAYRVQRGLVHRRKLNEIEDSLIVCEHTPIFTIGRSGKEENLLITNEVLKKDGIKVSRVDRGGDITFHGPGQLVAYPIIDLNHRGKDLHVYLRDLEEAAIRVLSEYSIPGKRVNGRTGVWVNDAKISFIGIAASNWVTYHGLSLNVSLDLRFFSMIRPCGFRDISVTSLREILERPIAVQEVKEKIIAHFEDIFNLKVLIHERDFACVA